jgi:hypothetical protein
VILPGRHEETTVALYIAHSHAFGAAHTTPYMNV